MHKDICVKSKTIKREKLFLKNYKTLSNGISKYNNYFEKDFYKEFFNIVSLFPNFKL